MDQGLDQQIAEHIAELRACRRTHLDLGMKLFASGGGWYMLDFLAWGSLNRSLQLTFAVCDLIEHQQSLAAAPLVRMQLDNALRFSAVYLVDNASAFAREVMRGTRISTLPDRTGAQLTDKYLVSKLEADQPWVRSVYDESSGFVHLSEKHIFGALRLREDPEDSPGGFQGYISERDVYIPPAFRLEVLQASKAATDLFLTLLDGWAEFKAQLPPSPDIANESAE